MVVRAVSDSQYDRSLIGTTGLLRGGNDPGIGTEPIYAGQELRFSQFTAQACGQGDTDPGDGGEEGAGSLSQKMRDLAIQLADDLE